MTNTNSTQSLWQYNIDCLIDEHIDALVRSLNDLDIDARITALNRIRLALHEISPLKKEPVDCVQWVRAELVHANDYNPNSVAPPEMRLLEHSIKEDGYTQPIVAWNNGEQFEVIDGFHRHRVGRESKMVLARIHGYLPLTIVNDTRLERSDRIASTIRHNRARGKHQVEAMSDIVIELKRRNWSDEKIGKELGMDPDEVLRLCQISGLIEVFGNEDFSKAWDIETPVDMAEEILAEEIVEPKESARILHTWDKWECYRAGFYEDRPPDGMSQTEGEEQYRVFLSDLDWFRESLNGVITKWTYSCEHYLTNERMNRIAWLGQASVAYALRIPSCCRGGYHRLTDSERKAADLLALEYLNKWLTTRGKAAMTLEEALSKTEMDLY